MPVVVLLIVLVVIALLLYKSVNDARQQGGAAPRSATPASTGHQAPRSRSRRPRASRRKVDEAALAAHVEKLREAVHGGLISVEEAIGSIVRQTDGALGEDAARKLLERDDAA
jgi:hypothetical protein